MKRTQVTSGAALILVVLFTMLLLAGILAATMRLGLGSRQNTADQAATLRAQYAAESTVGVVSNRLRDIQAMLYKERDGTNENFYIPGTTTKEAIKVHAQNFCGKSGASAWVATTEFAAKGPDNPKAYPNAVQCIIDGNSSFSVNQSSALADFLKLEAYGILPSRERPSVLNDRAIRLAWWNNLFAASDKIDVPNAKYRVQPVRVVQLTPTNYRFYIRADGVRVRGVESGATRVLTASRAQDSDWWFEIVLPSLLDDVLMTNHHRARPSGSYAPAGAPGVNFDDQVFDGSIHTNEKFLFTNSSSAQFKGKVNSVGCINLPQNGMPDSEDCDKTAGVYIGGSSGQKNPPSGTANPNKWIADEIAKSPRTVQFIKKGTPSVIDYEQTDFTASYKPLPVNENDQRAAAEAGGLMLDTNSLGVELFAGNSSGNPLTTYTPGIPRAEEGAWREPSPTYQYIKVFKEEMIKECTWDTSQWKSANYSEWNSTPENYRRINSNRYQVRPSSCKNVPRTVTEEYRADKDKNLYKKNAANEWILFKSDFNGVIYGSKFDILRGPQRKGSADDGSIGNVPPALASFSGITIASAGNINIENDLTVSDTPCAFATLSATTPCTKKPKNILGIYSQDGDIILKESTQRDLNIHAAMITSTGQVTAENYSTRPDQGEVKLIGSLIENWYGAFGMTGNPGKGYGRKFTYDQRLQEGTIPPFFPVSPRWQAESPSDVKGGMTKFVMRQASVGDF